MNGSLENDTSSLAGPLGIVLLPDSKTVEKAYELAADVLPKGSEYVLGRDSLPHITLYHGKIKHFPVKDAQSLIADLSKKLCGCQLRLERLVGFGGNFIFWNIDTEDAAAKILFEAHLKALEMAKYLDPTSIPKATSEEGLSLTEAESENVRAFGHPLVRDLYTPHITLGFERGVAKEFPSGRSQPWPCTFQSVELVRIGFPGRVEEVIGLGLA